MALEKPPALISCIHGRLSAENRWVREGYEVWGQCKYDESLVKKTFVWNFRPSSVGFCQQQVQGGDGVVSAPSVLSQKSVSEFVTVAVGRVDPRLAPWAIRLLTDRPSADGLNCKRDF